MSESPASRSTDTPAEPVNGGFPTAFGPDFGGREQPEPSPPDSFPVVPGRDLRGCLHNQVVAASLRASMRAPVSHTQASDTESRRS